MAPACARNPLSGYRLDRGRIRPYAASNTSPTYRTMHNLGSIVAEEAVQHGPAYPKVFRDVLAGVTVGLHPGGSAACGRPLLAMYWMVAGCGGQDESRRERHTIGKLAVHGGARNAQHLRDVIVSETGGGRERNPTENTSRKQATVVSEMWSLGPTTTRSCTGRPGHPTCRTRCRRGWPPPVIVADLREAQPHAGRELVLPIRVGGVVVMDHKPGRR